VLVSVALIACGRPLPPAPPESLAAAKAGDPSYNWPVSPDEALRRLANDHFEIRAVKGAGGGVTGAKKLDLQFADGLQLSAKWKKAPSGLDGWNNAPRKELAAYDIQKWFLDPADYVVPTSVVRCIPLAEYRKQEPNASPSVAGTDCELGILSLWMNNVTVVKPLYEEHRFETDGVYAYHMANFNLLTYLIDHRDGRAGNFLVSKKDADRRVFAVDNGISFRALVYNYFVPNWNDIEVPALRRAAVDRLRKVTFDDVRRLGIGTELRLASDGVFHVAEAGPNLNPKRGVRQKEGVVQFGLTDGEMDLVAKKIEKLLNDIDEGDIALF
jgi:hypothetical protein